LIPTPGPTTDIPVPRSALALSKRSFVPTPTPIPILILILLFLFIVHKCEHTQPRQHEVSNGRNSTGYPQPGGTRCKAELDDEVTSCGSKIANDDVSAEPPDCAHPRDDFVKRILWADEERLHPPRKTGIGPTRYDGVRYLQIDEDGRRE
jgi:hypothetical protein